MASLLMLVSTMDSQAQEPANPLDKAASRYAKLDGMRVHYKSLGEGTTALVFVHGWSCSLDFWKSQVPAFDGKVRLILIDLPGHGQSDKPMVDYSIELFARAVDAVLEDAGVEKAVLAGHSMGTPVVRQFYRLYPNKTQALVAVDGMLRPPNMKPADFQRLIARFSGPDYKENIDKFVQAMFPPSTPPQVLSSIKAAMHSTPQHVVIGAMKATFDPVIWKDDKVAVPLQAIMAKSRNATAEYEAYVRKLCPDLDYRVMDGVGHFLMMEKPDAFNEMLADFLKKQGVLKQ